VPAQVRGSVEETGSGVATHCNFGPQEIVDWFNALRAARFHYLQVAFPGASDADVSGCPKVTLQGRGAGREVATWDRSQD
jgi:isopropylmalate/homocitrate/citramalate synthase